MKKAPLVALIVFMCSLPAFPQNGFHEVRQSRPELCGKPGGVVQLPREFSVAYDHDGNAELVAKNGGASVRLSIYFSQIEEACPLADGRFVVFGDVGSGTSFAVVDGANPAHPDSVLTLYPLMSPDQRWIVYSKFYPRSTELAPSTEYLLYDLYKSPAQNRATGVSLDEHVDVGTAIYPVGWKNEPGDNIGAPEDQRHGLVFGPALPFFWAPDSRAIVFADSNVMGKYGVVLITIDEKAATTASVYPFPEAVECDSTGAATGGKGIQPTGLSRVEFGPQEGTDRVMFVDFEARGCTPKTLQLHRDSFQPAKMEDRVIEKPTRKTIKGDDRPQ